MAKGHDSAGAPTGAEAPAETPERWSAVRKTDVVLRLLKGDPRRWWPTIVLLKGTTMRGSLAHNRGNVPENECASYGQ